MGVVEQAEESRHVVVAGSPDVLSGAVAPNGDRIQVVRHQLESLIRSAAGSGGRCACIQHVIVAGSGDQRAFGAPQQRVHTHVSQPLLHVDDLVDLFPKRRVRAVVQHVEHMDQVAEVVGRYVGLLAVFVAIEIRVFAEVIENRVGASAG